MPWTMAWAERLFATLQTELLDRRSWPTRRVPKTAIFDYIEGFYNRRRRHSALGYPSPEDPRRRCWSTLQRAPAMVRFWDDVGTR